MNWDEYSRFYDWEFDLVCSEQKKDVKLWQKLAIQCGEPILEICCGSGRITKELAKLDLKITALDNSEKMLAKLRSLQLKNVEVIKADMRDFALNRKFNFIFISYSSFQQLLTLEDQKQCLETIKRHLTEDGKLALDISPFILEGSNILSKSHLFTAEYPPHHSTISMFTSHEIDWLNGIKHWQDEYLEIDNAGKKRIWQNRISLKHCDRDYLKLLFTVCGYETEMIFGDFDCGKVGKNSKNLIFLAHKRKR